MITTTPANTAAMNGTAERSVRISEDDRRTALLDADLPETFWCYAVEDSIEKSNHIPTKDRQFHLMEFSWAGVISATSCVKICSIRRRRLRTS